MKWFMRRNNSKHNDSLDFLLLLHIVLCCRLHPESDFWHGFAYVLETVLCVVLFSCFIPFYKPLWPTSPCLFEPHAFLVLVPT